MSPRVGGTTALRRAPAPKGGDSPTLALVGKGVTFDSGGLSIKPSASMEDMKADMTGAAVVAAAMQAVARLDLPVNLVGYLAITENMTGGRAMKLGDVLTIRNGKTVEVLNTDAEGRLILADALSFAVEKKPDRLIDLATLTGACMVALGTRIAGLFSNNEPSARSSSRPPRQTGERTWRMPLDDDFKEGLKSQVADMKNVGGNGAGPSPRPSSSSNSSARRLDPPGHRRPELGRIRQRHPRRRRDGLLRPHAGPLHRADGGDARRWDEDQADAGRQLQCEARRRRAAGRSGTRSGGC